MQAPETVIGYAAGEELDAFTIGYVQAFIWSSSDQTDDTGGRPLDETYTVNDIHPDSLASIVQDCQRFQAAYRPLWEADADTRDEYAGHNFLLNRNGHGAGFWDGDYPLNGDALSDACKTYGETDLEIGDDGKLHVFPLGELMTCVMCEHYLSFEKPDGGTVGMAEWVCNNPDCEM